MESECAHPPKDPNSLLLSQERLIHKAAGLSQFLINEVAVASVRLHFVHVFSGFILYEVEQIEYSVFLEVLLFNIIV